MTPEEECEEDVAEFMKSLNEELPIGLDAGFRKTILELNEGAYRTAYIKGMQRLGDSVSEALRGEA